MKKIFLILLILLFFILFISLSGQNMNKIYQLESIISINDFPVTEKGYIPIELKIFPGDGYILYSFHNDEDFSKQMIKIEKFSTNKKIEGDFLFNNPILYAKKRNTLSTSTLYEFLTIVDSKILFYNYYANSIEEYSEKFQLLTTFFLDEIIYSAFKKHDLDDKIKLLKEIKESNEKKNYFPGYHNFNNSINLLFIDKEKNLYFFNTSITSWDQGYEGVGEDQHSFFVRLKKEGDKYIEDTDFMLKFDGTQFWYPEKLIEKYKKIRLGHSSQEVGGQNISIYTAPYLDSFYYYNPGIFVQTTLGAQEIKEKVLTKKDYQKISDLGKKYNYERDKQFQYKISYMHTLYVDEDENIYVVSLKDIVIYDKNFNPVDMICPGNLKELGENVFIDEIVKIEGNKMWLSVRRYTGEIFTSQEQDTREIWVVDIK